MRKGATVVHLSRPGWRVAAISAALITGMAGALPGSAAAEDRAAAPSATRQVIATGLNNARHLRWSACIR